VSAGEPPATLRCVECATEAENGLGWRSYVVGVSDEIDDEEALAVYCPECAGREFGG
jgi:Zn finger protein HypA/HybF involved in hydrogenase expression